LGVYCLELSLSLIECLSRSVQKAQSIECRNEVRCGAFDGREVRNEESRTQDSSSTEPSLQCSYLAILASAFFSFPNQGLQPHCISLRLCFQSLLAHNESIRPHTCIACSSMGSRLWERQTQTRPAQRAGRLSQHQEGRGLTSLLRAPLTTITVHHTRSPF